MGPWFELDLPRPPSVNKLTIGRKTRWLGSGSPSVVRWIDKADKILMTRKPYPRLTAPYEIMLGFPEQEFSHYDADNFFKVLSDWMQRVELVSNDRYAKEGRWYFGEVPAGYCRVHLRLWVDAQ
jgi:Holliday junction resolvase RusA-like endonuclease